MTTQITVLGLNQVGTSIGLALAAHKEKITRIGNDSDISVARQAEKMGAFDKVVINLHNAVQDAEVVILALPVDEIEPTLRLIVDSLHPGTVVLDTSVVKVAVMEQAARLLGSERYFVSLTPATNPQYLHETIRGIETAHADLFKDSILAITSLPGTHSGAIQLAVDLATLLGGLPYFADPYEIDGLTAATVALPKLLAAALVTTVTAQSGWREARKFAGKTFASSTLPVASLDEQKSLGASALMNRENTLRLLDGLIASLQQVRGMLDRSESDALHEFLLHARDQRELWLNQRTKNEWDSSLAAPVPNTRNMLGGLIGLRRKDKKS